MELHGMSRPEVERIVTAAGATVVDVRPEPLLGTDWASYRYTIQR